MRTPTLLTDLFEAAPRSPEAAESRWRKAVAAVAEVFPTLVGAGGAALDDPNMLRAAFTAIELFVFRVNFVGLFDYCGGTYWAWRLDAGAGPLDTWVEIDRTQETVLEDGIPFQSHEVVYEFVVARHRLARAFPAPGCPAAPFDDHRSDTVIDAVVGAIGRRMLRLAAVQGNDLGGCDADLELRLLRTFGAGPPARTAAP